MTGTDAFCRFLRILGISSGSEIGADVYDKDGQMVPSWLRHPYIARFSIGWRMGDGEEYMRVFLEWWKQQNPDFQKRYRTQYRPPVDWLGFYKLISIFKD